MESIKDTVILSPDTDGDSLNKIGAEERHEEVNQNGISESENEENDEHPKAANKEATVTEFDQINNNASVNCAIKDQNLPFSYKFDNNITVTSAPILSIIDHITNWSDFNEALARYLCFVCSLLNDDLTNPKYAITTRLKWIAGNLCEPCSAIYRDKLDKLDADNSYTLASARIEEEKLGKSSHFNTDDRQMEPLKSPIIESDMPPTAAADNLDFCDECKKLCDCDVKFVKVPDVLDIARKNTVTLRSECLAFMAGNYCILSFGTDTSFDVLLKRFKSISESRSSSKELPTPILNAANKEKNRGEIWSSGTKGTNESKAFYAKHIHEIFRAHEPFIDGFIRTHMPDLYAKNNIISDVAANKIGNEAIEVAKLNKSVKFIVTGWSEGGSVAQLCALYLCALYGPDCLACYTFGQPRLGNGAFAKLFNEYVRLYFRVCNSTDPLPHLPAEGHIPLVNKIQIPGLGGPAMHPPHRRIRLAYPPSSLMLRANSGVAHDLKMKLKRTFRSHEMNFRVHTYYCGIHFVCKQYHTDQLPFYLYDRRLVDPKDKKLFQKKHGLVLIEIMNEVPKISHMVPIRAMVNTSIFHDTDESKERLRKLSMKLYLQDLCGDEVTVGKRLLMNEFREIKEKN